MHTDLATLSLAASYLVAMVALVGLTYRAGKRADAAEHRALEWERSARQLARKSANAKIENAKTVVAPHLHAPRRNDTPGLRLRYVVDSVSSLPGHDRTDEA